MAQVKSVINIKSILIWTGTIRTKYLTFDQKGYERSFDEQRKL